MKVKPWLQLRSQDVGDDRTTEVPTKDRSHVECSWTRRKVVLFCRWQSMGGGIPELLRLLKITLGVDPRGRTLIYPCEFEFHLV